MKKTLSGIGKVFFPFRNFKANTKRMLGWDQLKGSASNTYTSVREIWSRKKSAPSRKETFTEAVARLKLTEQDLIERRKSFFKTSLLFLGIAIALFVYTISLVFSKLILGSFIGLILVIMALALAYRDHFWYTQMKHRRLGLSFKDWFNYTFGETRHDK
ncbi:MAG: type IVB secretion system protein IcmV [Gammaproteobacteria bacterium]